MSNRGHMVKRTMKYVSLTAATETLRVFFPSYPSSGDVASLREIYMAAGRDLDQAEQNKNWVGNKLTHLKYHDLVKPLYAYSDDRRKVLDRIQLTKRGRDALAGPAPEESPKGGEDEGREVTLESIAKDIKLFEKLNPSIALDLSIKVRKDEPVS
jgi:hypothetical protein